MKRIGLLLVLLAVTFWWVGGWVPPAAIWATPASAQETGFASKKPVLAAACRTCPWGALGEVVKAAMQPYGYDVQICYSCYGTTHNTGLVAGAGMPSRERFRPPLIDTPSLSYVQVPWPPPNGPVDFGITSKGALWSAYQGKGRNLRLLAAIQHPNYDLIVAVKADLGITDLSQIREKRWPVRIILGDGMATDVLAYYGLTPASIESAGGHIGQGMLPEERKDFDVIIHGGSLQNSPEWNVWYEVSQKFDLRFLPLPQDLLEKLAKDRNGEIRNIPNGLLRGMDRTIPTVARTGHAIYGRDDMPDEFAYTVAKAMDEQQDLLQWSLLNFSYNPRTVWKAFGVPLHPGAARYYRERGYIE